MYRSYRSFELPNGTTVQTCPAGLGTYSQLINAFCALIHRLQGIPLREERRKALICASHSSLVKHVGLVMVLAPSTLFRETIRRTLSRHSDYFGSSPGFTLQITQKPVLGARQRSCNTKPSSRTNSMPRLEAHPLGYCMSWYSRTRLSILTHAHYRDMPTFPINGRPIPSTSKCSESAT